jgi:4-amino-4-deoxy-L-arabinose transferase-like glycosyltransferase
MRKRLPIAVTLLAFAALYATSLDAYGMFGWDEAEYATLGRSVARGEGYAISGRANVHRPPGVPLVIAGAIAATGSTADTTLRAVAVGLSLITLLLVYLAVEHVLGPIWSTVAVILLGVMPAFWTRAPMVMTDVAFIGLFTLAVFTFTRACDESPRLFWVSWTMFALALMTRYTAVLFGPVVLLLLLRRIRRAPVRSVHFWVAPFAAIVIVGPWLLRTHAITGDALAGFRMASGQLPAYAPGVSHPWWQYGAMLLTMATFVGVVTFVAGVLRGMADRNGFVIDATIVAAFLLVYLSAYRYKEDRLILAVLPFVASVAAWLLRELRPRSAAALIVAAVIVSAAIPARRTLTNTVSIGHPSFLSAMRYLREHSGRNDLVMSASEPQTAWYADRRVVPFGQKGARWIVVTNFERGQPPAASKLKTDVVFTDGVFRTGIVDDRQPH